MNREEVVEKVYKNIASGCAKFRGEEFDVICWYINRIDVIVVGCDRDSCLVEIYSGNVKMSFATDPSLEKVVDADKTEL